MKKLICGQDNQNEFRAKLKALAPDFIPLAKALYTAGLIVGLRGASIENPTYAETQTEPEALPVVNKKTCEECQNWQRDRVGDGTGLGQCLPGYLPRVLKWPGQSACADFLGLV